MESIAAIVWSLLLLAVFCAVAFSLVGCNADQIASLEIERDRLAAESVDNAAAIEALDAALEQAGKVASTARDAQAIAEAKAEAETISHAKALIAVKQQNNRKRAKDNERLLKAANDPNEAIQDAIAATAPMLPPPFNYLLPVLSAGIFGEVARRRGNRKVQRVGQVLEMSGAVKFNDEGSGRSAATEMGSHINANLSIGRDKAKADISRFESIRPKG